MLELLMQMFLQVLGLNAAHATYACVWRNVKISQRCYNCNIIYNNNLACHRCDMTKTIHDYKKRTIEALLETDEDVPKTQDCIQKRKGRVNNPLIDLDNWIPDELHLMLRVTDVLTRNLINAAANQDRKDGRHSENINDGPMIQKLVESIRSCGVPFKIRSADKKVFCFTSLVGSDKLNIIKKDTRENQTVPANRHH